MLSLFCFQFSPATCRWGNISPQNFVNAPFPTKRQNKKRIPSDMSPGKEIIDKVDLVLIYAAAVEKKEGFLGDFSSIRAKKTLVTNNSSISITTTTSTFTHHYNSVCYNFFSVIIIISCYKLLLIIISC